MEIMRIFAIICLLSFASTITMAQNQEPKKTEKKEDTTMVKEKTDNKCQKKEKESESSGTSFFPIIFFPITK